MRNSNMQNRNMPRCAMPMCDVQESHMRMERDYYMRNNDSCKCDEYPLGMSYVPWQTFRELYDPEKSLEAGTMFMELDKPFLGKGAFRR